MRLLLDENFPGELAHWLRDQGHDVLWARVDFPEWSDSRLLDLAEEQGRIVFTLDRDFEQIARQRRTPLRWAGVVLFRLHPNFVEDLWPGVVAILASNTDRRGAVTIVAHHGIEVTRVGPSL